MRKRIIGLGLILLVMAIAGALLLSTTPASGASPAPTVTSSAVTTVVVPPGAATPAKPGPRGVYTFGPIKNAAHPTWCITAPRSPVDGSPLFMAQCVRNDAYQYWHCTRFRGIGECSLSTGDEPLDIGQYGKNDSRVKVINPDKGGRYNYILGYVSLSNERYVLSNEGDSNKFLAMPVKFVKDRVFPLHWFTSGTRGYTYPLKFPAWKEDPTVTTAATAPAKPGPRGSQATGYIKDEAHPGWCVTAPPALTSGAIAFLAQCVAKGAVHARQVWHCGMFRGLGECSPIVGDEPLNIGQVGKNDFVKVIDPNKNGNLNYILDFGKVTGVNNYMVSNLGYSSKTYIAMPSVLKAGREYELHWLHVHGPRGYTYVLTFPTFKEDPAIPPSLTAATTAKKTVVTPDKPGPRGVYYTGILQDVANPAWCLMTVHDPKDNDPVILVQCLRRGDNKGWIATMFRGIGRISMPIPPDGLTLGQTGKNNNTVRLVDPDKGGRNYILYFVKAAGSDHYAIKNISYAGYFLSMPAHPKNGNAYLVRWEPSNTKGYTKAIHIGPWKEDPEVKPTISRYNLAV